MDDLPAPLVGAEVDLKDFPYTPIFRARLFGSAFQSLTSDAEWRAGVTLWLKSWDQVPAGTLPCDAQSLCRLAELGRDLKTWGKVAGGALHGWFKASDGRLHHRVVAEGVNQAWQNKCARRDRTEAARVARATKRLSQSMSQTDRDANTPSVTGSNRNRDRNRPLEEEDSEANASGGSAPPQPDRVKEIWARGVALVGEKNRSFIGKLRKEYSDIVVMEAIIQAENELPSDPVEYLVGCCNRRKNGNGTHSRALDILGRAALDYDERAGDSGVAQAPH